MSRKKPTNTVLLMVENLVVARFEPKESEEGKTTPAMRQASKFLAEVWHDEDHELHEDLHAQRVDLVNAEIKKPGMKTKTVFSID